MDKIIKQIILCLLIALVCDSSWAVPNISGYLSSYVVYRVADIENPRDDNEDDFMKFENKIRIEMRGETSFGPFSSSLFVSGDIRYDPYWIESDSDFETTEKHASARLKSAYIDISHENFEMDLRLGKQVVTWGNSDGMPVTDIVTPLNMSEFMLPDLEDLRIAIPMAKLNYYFGEYILEGVFIPKFYPYELSSSGHWKIEPDFEEFERQTNFGIGGIRPVEMMPDGTDEYEYGIKLSGFLFDTDFSIMFFQTREDRPTPVMPPTIIYPNVFDADSATPIIKAPIIYNKLNMYGFTLARPISSFVLRSEGAFYKGKKFPSMDPVNTNSMWNLTRIALSFEDTGTMYEKDYLHYMIGSDYSGFSGWMLSGQFETKHILDFDKDERLTNMVSVAKLVANYDKDNSLEELLNIAETMSGPDGKQEETENSITLVVQRGDPVQDTFYWRLVYRKNLTSEDHLIQFATGYSFRAGIWLQMGYNQLEGEYNTELGMFDENDNINLKLKYSF